MLKTVYRPTKSADGYTFLSSAKFCQLVLFTILNHAV